MVKKYISLKKKIRKQKDIPCAFKILKHLKYFSVDNMKKARLNECIYDFSVDYDTIAVDDILDIHKYLM